MTTPGTTESRHATDPAEVHRALALLLEPGQVTELRALDVSTPSYRRPHTVSGFFDDVQALVESLGSIERSAKGIYVIPNPVDAALLARSQPPARRDRSRAANRRQRRRRPTLAPSRR